MSAAPRLGAVCAGFRSDDNAYGGECVRGLSPGRHFGNALVQLWHHGTM